MNYSAIGKTHDFLLLSGWVIFKDVVKMAAACVIHVYSPIKTLESCTFRSLGLTFGSR